MRNFKKVILGAALSMVCTVAFAQQLTVKGVVKQPDGETVIGATVTEKGTTNATVTDLDGNFTLAVKSGAELVISYIGFNTVTTAAKPQMDITLSEDAKVIDEVVVTGYTTQRKADLTGAVSVVSVTDLQKQNENNPMKALQGRVPGMNISADGSPSGAATVRIRGIGTLNNNDPLYIIDGVPTKAGMHELNGNDIESIQILKDAASASIYGSRAANGVIIITTKKGKDGKLKVDLDASVAASMYSHKMEVLNAKEFGQVMWQGYVNDGMDPNTNGLGYHYDWGYNAQGQAVLNGISMKKYLDDAGTTPAADTDWYDLTTRTGVIQNYNVSVSNGSQKGSSFFSLGYYKNLGIIKTSDFERFSARFNTEYKLIGDKLTIGEHFTLNRTSEVAAPGGFLKSSSLVNFFGKLNYNFADRYMASLTLRRDGSSRFGKENRYATFPSVSAGWRINNEKFMKGTNSWLDDLKLRASWGQTGNQEISNLARYTVYVSNYGVNENGGQSYGTSYDIAGTNGGQTLASGFKRNQLGNNNIKWETTTQTNLGIDYALFNNSLYGTFDWYYKKTKDILIQMAGIAAMGEGSSQWINAGEMENKGFEFNIGYRKNTAWGLRYDINANISTYRNKITKLPTTVAANGTFGGNGVKSVIGHAMGSQVGYVADGIFKSQDEIDNHATQEGAALGRIRWKDLNDDGKITETDQEWIYDPTPDFTYGFNIYLEYKNFDFTAFFQGVQGVDIISDLKKETDIWAGLNIGFLNKGRRLLDAWSPTNPNSNIPAVSLSDNNNEKRVSSYWVENGSYLKLRTVQLGYNVPKSFAQKLAMERLRFYLSAQNVFTIKSSSFTGVDPENPNYGYPIPLNITFGLNVTF